MAVLFLDSTELNEDLSTMLNFKRVELKGGGGGWYKQREDGNGPNINILIPGTKHNVSTVTKARKDALFLPWQASSKFHSQEDSLCTAAETRENAEQPYVIK